MSASAPSMTSSSGVRVPCEDDGANHKSMATATPRGGWEGSRRRSRDPRNTWRAVIVAVGCAYEAWRSGRAGSAWRSPMSIKGPLRRRGGCAVKVAGLTWGDLHGCPRCPVRLVRGVVRDGGGRKDAARRGEVSRGQSTGGIADRREGPNAKPSVRTFVLVIVALTAAIPLGGLAGRVQR